MWKTLIFQIIFLAIVFIVIYGLLKKYVLSKLHPNKIVILALAVISFLLPGIVAVVVKKNMNKSILQYISSGLFVIFFLWFLDLHNGVMYGNGKNRRDKDIKIRPKPKPNRVHKNSSNNKK